MFQPCAWLSNITLSYLFLPLEKPTPFSSFYFLPLFFRYFSALFSCTSQTPVTAFPTRLRAARAHGREVKVIRIGSGVAQWRRRSTTGRCRRRTSRIFRSSCFWRKKHDAKSVRSNHTFLRHLTRIFHLILFFVSFYWNFPLKLLIAKKENIFTLKFTLKIEWSAHCTLQVCKICECWVYN